MGLPIYQVDAFADAVFKGNPAAIMPLEEWLDDAILQAIAMENNLSDTAYLVRKGNGHELRDAQLTYGRSPAPLPPVGPVLT